MKEVIDDVVVCFNGTNANKELENKISLLNVPYKRTRNKLIVDYGFVIVNIHFLTKNSNFDAPSKQPHPGVFFYFGSFQR